MPVARSTRETFAYVTEADRQLPKEQQTTFRLQVLSTDAVLKMKNLRDGFQPEIGSCMLVALAAGLAGWDNFSDADGKPVEFVDFRKVQGAASRAEKIDLCGALGIDQVAARSSLDRLSAADAQEIALAILKGNELTADDAKNS